MIGLILLTHGQMAPECLRTVEMIVGPVEACRALSIDRTSSLEIATRELSAAIEQVGAEGQGVLILTDLFGGTPTNLAADFLAAGEVEILCGFNLPMLIKAVSLRRGKSLTELAEFLREYGQQAIIRPADLLKARSE
jgi:PTS system mannose-specific IIA component